MVRLVFIHLKRKKALLYLLCSLFTLYFCKHKKNNMSTAKSYSLFIVSLIALGIFSRFIPHPPNATAIGALAIFGGFAFKRFWMAAAILFTALFISDLAINNIVYGAYNNGFILFTSGATFIYGGFLLSIVLGKNIKNRYTLSRIGSATILSVLAFFLLTNAGVWAASPMYPASFSGLISAYVAGIPFALNQLIATALYSAVLFGAHALYTRKSPVVA